MRKSYRSIIARRPVSAITTTPIPHRFAPAPIRWRCQALMLAAALSQPVLAAQTIINGPPGSGGFGRAVSVLPNGNFVVSDPLFDLPDGTANVGAVYLYSPDGEPISTLTGSVTNDSVGNGGVIVLATGNFLVPSGSWGAINEGAVTFASGLSGVSGPVSAANSLVGSQANDGVGSPGRIFLLANGNYVVASSSWDNVAVTDAGAVTWGSGSTGVVGPVAANNSLVGTSANDELGNSDPGVLALSNGNYVVLSPLWDGDGRINNGAITFANGATGITGPVSLSNSFVSHADNPSVFPMTAVALANGNYVIQDPGWDNSGMLNVGAATFASGNTGLTGFATLSNSLVGTAANDQVATDIVPLDNGNYLVISLQWSGRRGAVTLGSGSSGITGSVSLSNSLLGSTPGDRLGLAHTLLSNGNYVLATPYWDNAATVDAGAVTFGSAIAGVTGLVSASNSLVGTVANDLLGLDDITALTNGNYVVNCSICDIDGRVDAGAATFGSGISGVAGAVGSANSLVGASAGDRVGENARTTALANGNYVVATPNWDTGATVNVGAATFALGTTGISGLVTSANSLIGSSAQDRVGAGGATALSNGNYVVVSSSWRNGANMNAGAATFASGLTGLIGSVSAVNSLVGGSSGDLVGAGKITALSTGNYVVVSSYWHNGAVVNAGAATWGSGITGVTGTVASANSLLGTHTDDQLGLVLNPSGNYAIALPDGNYVLLSPYWDNGNIFNAGAATLGLGGAAQIGALTTDNSVFGTITGPAQVAAPVYAYDPARTQLIVGQPTQQRVILLRTVVLFTDGFE